MFNGRMLPSSVHCIGKSQTPREFSFAYCIVFDPSIYKLADGINEEDEVPRSFAGVREKENRNCHAYKKH